MDSTPPQIVVLEVAACHDSVAASEELRDALAPAAAPTADWKVRVRFSRSGGRLTVHGDVVNPAEEVVATRSLSTAGADCASLARGVGVWASLVLDAEVERAPSTDRLPPPVAPPPDDPLAAPPAARATASRLWPEPDPELRSPEHEVFLSHSKEQRTVELGLSAFVMGGTCGGAVVGPSAYGVFEAQHGFFFRPALLLGHSVGGISPTTEAPATFLASRFDACARLPGLYREGRGLQLDLCGGAEVGFSRIDSGVLEAASSPTSPGSPSQASQPSRTLPFIALGPSLGVRGELTRNLSAIVRGVADVSLLRDQVTLATGGVVTPPVFAARAEVGLSWTLR